MDDLTTPHSPAWTGIMWTSATGSIKSVAAPIRCLAPGWFEVTGALPAKLEEHLRVGVQITVHAERCEPFAGVAVSRVGGRLRVRPINVVEGHLPPTMKVRAARATLASILKNPADEHATQAEALAALAPDALRMLALVMVEEIHDLTERVESAESNVSDMESAMQSGRWCVCDEE